MNAPANKDEAATNEPIVIKKVKKGGHEDHHGSAWKVAYADFTTAMMAFFMLLWLLNVTTEDQKRGIADYFAPTAASHSFSGSGGVLSGRSFDERGARVSETTRDSVQLEMAPSQPRGGGEATLASGEDPEDTGQSRVTREEEADGGEDERLVTSIGPLPDDSLTQQEQDRFADAEAQIKQAIQRMPELAEVADQVLIDLTPEGLRIQLIDQSKEAMFASGSAQPYEHTRQLIGQIARVVSRLPNRIAITGHTDAMPYPLGSSYTNWELSSDRANASRRALVEAGVSPRRIAHVSGKAAQEPLDSKNPSSPRNRRISIIVLREAPVLPPNLK